MIFRLGRRTPAAVAIATAIVLAGCEDKKEARQQPAPPVVEAPKADPEATRRQAAEIRQAVDEYLALSAGPANLRRLAHAGVTVTPVREGAGFDVVVDGLRIGSPDTGHLDVGSIAYRLTPKGEDTYVISDLRYAEAMSYADDGGTRRGTLKVPTTAFSGEWSRPLQTFTALDWRIAGLEAAGESDHGGALRIDEGAVKVNTVDSGDNRVDQTTRLTLNRITIRDDANGVVGIDAVTFGGIVRGFGMKEFLPHARTAQERLKALKPTAGTPSPTAPNASAPDPQQLKILGELYLAALRLIGAVETRFAVEGLAYTAADGTRPFRLAAAGLDVRVADLALERSTAGLGIAFSGLAVEAPGLSDDPLAGKLLPRTGKFEINLSGLPARAIVEAVIGDLPRLTGADEADRQTAAESVGTVISDLIQQSPMQLAVNPSTVASDVATIGASGRFTVDPRLATGIAGSLDVTVGGLDAALGLAESAAPMSPDAAGMAELLTALKAQADRGRSDDGSIVDRFRIDIDPAGQLMVNGQPMGRM